MSGTDMFKTIAKLLTSGISFPVFVRDALSVIGQKSAHISLLGTIVKVKARVWEEEEWKRSERGNLSRKIEMWVRS